MKVNYYMKHDSQTMFYNDKWQVLCEYNAYGNADRILYLALLNAFLALHIPWILNIAVGFCFRNCSRLSLNQVTPKVIITDSPILIQNILGRFKRLPTLYITVYSSHSDPQPPDVVKDATLHQ